MEFTDRSYGVLTTPGHGLVEADLIAALQAYLLGKYSERVIEDSVRRTKIGQPWWSDTYGGFTHDCSKHDPAEGVKPGQETEDNPVTCWPDSVAVTTLAVPCLYAEP